MSYAVGRATTRDAPGVRGAGGYGVVATGRPSWRTHRSGAAQPARAASGRCRNPQAASTGIFSELNQSTPGVFVACGKASTSDRPCRSGPGRMGRTVAPKSWRSTLRAAWILETAREYPDSTLCLDRQRSRAASVPRVAQGGTRSPSATPRRPTRITQSTGASPFSGARRFPRAPDYAIRGARITNPAH